MTRHQPRRPRAKAPAKKAPGEGTSQEGRGEGTSQEGRGEGTSYAERTPQTPNFTPDVDAAAERIKKTSERVSS